MNLRPATRTANVPNRGRIKCGLAIAKGKKLHDKRETERKKTAEDEVRAEMRRRA